MVWRETSIASASCCWESSRAVRSVRTSLRIGWKACLTYVKVACHGVGVKHPFHHAPPDAGRRLPRRVAAGEAWGALRTHPVAHGRAPGGARGLEHGVADRERRGL